MHFLIWLPQTERRTPPKQLLGDVGLDDCVPGAHFQDLEEGPCGNAGTLVSWPTPRNRVWKYSEDVQTWIPAVPDGELAAGRYWLGWHTDSPPTPEDVLRTYFFNGQTVELGDKQRWLLPAPHELPWDVIRADDGSYAYEPQRRFVRYILACQEWQRMFRELHAGKRDGISVSDLAEFIEGALRINYRLPRELPSILRLFSTSGNGTLEAALNLVVRVAP